VTTAPETPDTEAEILDSNDPEPATDPGQATVDPSTTLATVTYPSDDQAKAVKIAELVRDLTSLLLVDDPAPSLAALERLTVETEDLTDPAEREWTRALLAHLRVGVRMAEERTLGTEDPEPLEEPEPEDDRDITDDDDLAATAPPTP
jgi:hypothetical protein